MTLENSIISPVPEVTNFFCDRQIVSLNSFPETVDRINVTIYLLKSKEDKYMMIINFGKSWNWTEEHDLNDILGEYDKFLSHEKRIRFLKEVLH
jgi:hypothetical protein